MQYKYELTVQAIEDIDDVLDYIALSLNNKKASDKLFFSVQNSISDICENPFAYPNCSYYYVDDPNIRHTIIGNYIMVFEVKKAEEKVIVLRFLYGGRDITNIL